MNFSISRNVDYERFTGSLTLGFIDNALQSDDYSWTTINMTEQVQEVVDIENIIFNNRISFNIGQYIQDVEI